MFQVRMKDDHVTCDERSPEKTRPDYIEQKNKTIKNEGKTKNTGKQKNHKIKKPQKTKNKKTK